MTAKIIYLKSLEILKNKYVISMMLIAVIFSFLMSNLFWISHGKYSFAQIVFVLRDPSHNVIEIGQTSYNLTNQDYRNISESIWAVLAAIVGAAGLSIAGLAVQALTKNPLADASTLGFVQGGIFSLLVTLSFGWTEYYIKYIAIIVGIGLAAILLTIVLIFNKNRVTTAKVILAGLAIGIIFKSFSYLVRSGDSFITSVSFNYTLGGPESVNKSIGSNQWEMLYISSGIILAAILIFAIISKPLTILELGDDRAKQLGIRVKTTKLTTLVVIIMLIPAAVIILGNLAFIGLFAVHISRYFFRTRSYFKLLLPSIVVGVIMAQFGLFLFHCFPKVNSGIWMTIIGAPYIIYAGYRGLK